AARRPPAPRPGSVTRPQPRRRRLPPPRAIPCGADVQAPRQPGSLPAPCPAWSNAAAGGILPIFISSAARQRQATSVAAGRRAPVVGGLLLFSPSLFQYESEIWLLIGLQFFIMTL